MKNYIALTFFVLTFAFVGCQTHNSAGGEGAVLSSGGATNSLYVLPHGIETRWASAENWQGQRGAGGKARAGRKGSPSFRLRAGKSQVLAEVEGSSGMVRRIWITINRRTPDTLRGIRIDMYWDGAQKPAVSAPLGDFFCHGLGRMATFDSSLFSSPEGRSFNCCIPMPFKTGMKVVVTNESKTDVVMFYDVDYTLGGGFADNMLYFHAHWRRENPTTLQKDYHLLPKVGGSGRFLGVNVGVTADTAKYFNSWWGEGEVKVFLDGDKEYPTLCGTGTEDYIGTGWGQGQYATLYQGCHVADHEKMQFCFYRWHVPDPVYFRKDIRITIHQIGWGSGDVKKKMKEAGTTIYRASEGLVEVDLDKPGGIGLFERQDDWSSCAYFYLDKPVSSLPKLAPFDERKL